MKNRQNEHINNQTNGYISFRKPAMTERFIPMGEREDISCALRTVTNLSLFTFHAKGKCVAFTLAETLITLGIIGVVAAVTLPTVIQNHQDKVLISQTKKVWADMNNALYLSQQEYGVIGDNSYLFNATDSHYTIAQNFAKYFKGALVCQNVNQSGCSKYYYDIKFATIERNANGDITTTGIGTSPKIILTNGAIINISSNKSGCEPKIYTAYDKDSSGNYIRNEDGTLKTHTYTSDICANISFDVNGAKPPNQYGRDVYLSYVYRNKLKETTTASRGAKSFFNILTGKNKLEYVKY